MLFAGRLALLCVMAVTLQGAAGSSIAAVLARVRAASGPTYKYHIVSTSRSMQEGIEGESRTDSLGVPFITKTCRSALCTGSYFDGAQLYTIDINDTVLPNQPGTEAFTRAARTVNSGAFLAPDFAAQGGSIADLRTARLRGKTYRVLGVQAADAIPLAVYIDPKTNLVAYVRDYNNQVTLEPRSYHKVGPLELPFEIYQDGDLVQQYDQRSIVPGPLSVPRGLGVRFPTAAAPLTMSGSGLTPVIPCTIAQIATKCLIDTGNSGLSISIELTERLNLVPFGAFEVRGLGRYATGVVRAGPLTLGDVSFAQANYIVLHDIHRFGFDVVLGADIMARATTTLDYKARTVTFSDPAAGISGSTFPLSFLNFVPVITVRLSNVPSLLALDTGDESVVNLGYDFYQAHPALFTPTETLGVSGVGASSEQVTGIIPQVSVGGFTVNNVRIGATKNLRATAEGHLGSGFLSHFRVVLDYAHARMGLTQAL